MEYFVAVGAGIGTAGDGAAGDGAPGEVGRVGAKVGVRDGAEAADDGVHQADRLTRYIGASDRRPTLSRLGGAEWKTVKSKVKKSVEVIAEDLLELYAKRQVAQGYAFSDDAPWQNELEASFPYIETDDQELVIEQVKQDMESSRPMDRLVCV